MAIASSSGLDDFPQHLPNGRRGGSAAAPPRQRRGHEARNFLIMEKSAAVVCGGGVVAVRSSGNVTIRNGRPSSQYAASAPHRVRSTSSRGSVGRMFRVPRVHITRFPH